MNSLRPTTSRWTSHFEPSFESTTPPRLPIPTDEDDDTSSSGYPDIVSYATTPDISRPTSPTPLHHHGLSYAHDSTETATRVAFLACLLFGVVISLWEPAPNPSGLSMRIANRPVEKALLALKGAWPTGRRGVALFLLVASGVVMLVRALARRRAGAITGANEKNSVQWGRRGDDRVSMESQMSIFWEGMRVQ